MYEGELALDAYKSQWHNNGSPVGLWTEGPNEYQQWY